MKSDVNIIKANIGMYVGVLDKITKGNVYLTDKDLKIIDNSIMVIFSLSHELLVKKFKCGAIEYTEDDLDEIFEFVYSLVGEQYEQQMNEYNMVRLLGIPSEKTDRYLIYYLVRTFIDYYALLPKYQHDIQYIKGLENLALKINLNMANKFSQFKTFFEVFDNLYLNLKE